MRRQPPLARFLRRFQWWRNLIARLYRDQRRRNLEARIELIKKLQSRSSDED